MLNPKAMQELPFSHDAFFTAVFSDVERTKAYLKAFLPSHILQAVKIDTLTPEEGSFVDEQLRKTFADLIFSVETQSGQPSDLCLLFEHKSYPDKHAAFQILHYISSAMLKRVKANEPPRLVLPILMYHGQQPLAYLPIRHFFEPVDSAFQPYLPDFEYIFHNFLKIPDEQIEHIEPTLLSAALLVMKHFYDSGYLEENASVLLLKAMDEHGNLFKPLVVYFFNKMKADEDRVQEIIVDLPDTIKPSVMSTLELFVQKGLKEGLEQKTIVTCQNMIRLGLDDRTICDALEVSPEFVAQIRNEMEGKTSDAANTVDTLVEEGEQRKAKEACQNMIRRGFEDPIICEILAVTPEFVQQVREELVRLDRNV